jgi:hypothetical protein
MRELWTFTTKDKLDKFLVIMGSHELDCEVSAVAKNKFVVSVEEGIYAKAKRVLLKHRERRTSGDTINSNDRKNQGEDAAL